ncbi:MAG: tripartite tricarboxylate transporter substrate binding protein [Casimicrobiaceae bacterium]|nr:tripartite tricarboxylate transporter substrate binding protein [Casimicrobiaceae bacterium]
MKLTSNWLGGADRAFCRRKQRAVVLLAPILLGVGLVWPSLAQTAAGSPGSAAWPTKAVRIIVPFPPGGSVDVTTRQLAQKLAESLGQPVVVENRPGAGGNIGMEALARSAPDGYTLGIGALSTHAVNPWLYPKMPFDPQRDFAPVSLLVVTPNVLVTNPNVLPANDVSGIVEFAKRNPGKVNCASGSAGSAGHLACELFRLITGAPIAHIPYKGAAPAVTDLLGGQVQMMFDNLANAMPHLKAGKTRAFAVTTPRRSALAPELPTMAEIGFRDFDVYTWWGLFAPAGTPSELIRRLNAEVQRALASTDLREKWLANGAEPSPTTPEGFSAFIARELPKYARIVKESGAKLD